MDNQKLKIVTARQLIILILLFFTTIIYYLSLYQGTGGIGLKIFGGGDDGQFYWEQAQNVANNEPWIRTSIYPLLLGNLIKITGINDVYIVRILNIVGFNLLIIYSIKILNIINFQFLLNKNFDNFQYKSIQKLLICYIFYISLISTVTISIYRDIWIYTFYVIALYYSIRLIFMNMNKVYNLLFLFFAIYMIYEFRKYAALSFVLVLIVSLIINKLSIFKNKMLLSTLTIIFFLLYYIFFKDFKISEYSLARALDYRFEGIEFFSGGSNMNIMLNQKNPVLFFMNYIHSFLGNFIGPLPWHIRGVSMLVIFMLETIPMIYILIYILKYKSFLNEVQKYILLHSFVWIGIIAITNDNIGTATRLRPVAWTLILIIYCSLIYISEKEHEK